MPNPTAFPIPLPHYIIPAILAYTEVEFREKWEKARKMKAKMVQIDVLDNTFIKNKNFADLKKLAKINLDIPFEVHLMVSHPEKHVEQWAKLGAKRIIFHLEATDDPKMVIKSIKKAGSKPVIALNPDTSIAALDLIFPSISAILVMGVYPGYGGQRFRPSVLKKIKLLKTKFPKLPIEVDGGVRVTNAQKILTAGADALAVGSALFKTVL